MATEHILNNYSDDSQIKDYINYELMPRVFKNIPMNLLNTGEIGIINEYLSQALENQSFTSSFYFNESFITKVVLPDSIYAEAAIFNLDIHMQHHHHAIYYWNYHWMIFTETPNSILRRVCMNSYWIRIQ